MQKELQQNQHEVNQRARELLLQILDEGLEPDPNQLWILLALQIANDPPPEVDDQKLDVERLNNTLADDDLYRLNWNQIQDKLLEIAYLSPKQQMKIFNDPEGRFLLDTDQMQEDPSKALYELMCDLMSWMIDNQELPH